MVSSFIVCSKISLRGKAILKYTSLRLRFSYITCMILPLILNFAAHVLMWNSLASVIVNSTSVAAFKRALVSFDFSLFLNYAF